MDFFGSKVLGEISRVVTVEEGILEGIPAGNPAYTIFKGVPFATPPVGAYRWRGAAPAEKWEGVRKCDVFPPISIQAPQMEGGFYQKEFFPAPVPMSEDCLYLNIWTPDTTGTKKLPVMFWIHGGGFQGGYSHELEFDGEAMCKRGVILVTVTYRLGALGFFAHPELSARCPHKVSGNYAITDCIQALKWVKANIAKFGGDPDCVTIFGQSAGGAMTQSLVTSPIAKGLFARAIVQSAGGINTLGGATMADLENLGVAVCEKLGLTIDELKALPEAECFEKVNTAVREIRGFGLHYTPCSDGYYQPKLAGAAIAANEHHNIDYMTGSVSGDGGLFGGRPVATVAEFEAGIRAANGALADKYLELYNVKSDDDLPAINSARTAVGSKLAPRGWAFSEIKNGRKPIYAYYFDRKMPGDGAGAYHSSELWYIFGTIDRCWRSMEPGFCLGDYALSRAMTDYWTNFAKTGNPNGDTVPEWPAFTSDTPVTMTLTEKEIIAKDLGGDKILDGTVSLLMEQVFSE